MRNEKSLLFFILLMACLKVPAQLCQGSLGDPIINITFGAGSNPGPALTTTKNLNYIYGDCPQDGFYTIRNNTSGCFANTWHTINSDHTGDPNGYFMLINASLERSEFYIDTLKGLCPNTTYEFAAWVMNVILTSACRGNTIKPNLTFNVEKTDGTVLQTYNTGDIPTDQAPTWKQYGSFFTTPANVTSVVLRLVNNSTGGCGNDIAIDDITFRPCGPQLNPSINGVTDRIKTLCSGESADITFQCQVSSGYTNPVFLWQRSSDGGGTWVDIPGETKNTMVRNFAATTAVGTYLYRLTVGEGGNIALTTCRVSSAVLAVNVKSNPVTSVSSNSPTCQGTAISLSATGGTADNQYSWSGSNSFTSVGSTVSIKNAQSVDAGKYFVHVTDTNGCKHTDSTTVIVTPAPVVTTTVNNASICLGDSVLLGSSGGIAYAWSPAKGLSSASIANPVARPSDSTIYTVVASNSASCKDSATVTINVISRPIANAGPDKEMMEGQWVQLNGGVVGGNPGNNDITWSPPTFINNIHALEPVVSPPTNATYVLTAKSNNNCGSSSDMVQVRVYKKVIIPNAFSPNGDGVNDVWNISALSAYENYQLSVFTRYGQVVYTSKNYIEPWDGTFNGRPLPVGTYYYLLNLKVGLPVLTGYVAILK